MEGKTKGYNLVHVFIKPKKWCKREEIDGRGITQEINHKKWVDIMSKPGKDHEKI